MSFHKWTIYRANLDPVVGSEQGKTRPVIVISEDEINDILNNVNVLPVTSRKPGRTIYPNEILIEAKKYGLPNESIILCHQIRTLDKTRLTFVYGIIDDQMKRDQIINSLCFQLGIEKTTYR